MLVCLCLVLFVCILNCIPIRTHNVQTLYSICSMSVILRGGDFQHVHVCASRKMLVALRCTCAEKVFRMPRLRGSHDARDALGWPAVGQHYAQIGSHPKTYLHRCVFEGYSRWVSVSPPKPPRAVPLVFTRLRSPRGIRHTVTHSPHTYTPPQALAVASKIAHACARASSVCACLWLGLVVAPSTPRAV